RRSASPPPSPWASTSEAMGPGPGYGVQEGQAGRSRRLPLLLALLLLSPSPFALLRAQEAPVDTTEVPAETLEALAEDGAAGDPTVLLEALADLRANPLDVNAATAEELAQIPAFSPLLAQAIVAFRAVNGPFASLPEVQRVAGVTADVYLDARPYLRIGARVEGEAPRPSPYPLVPSVREVAGGLRYTLTQRVQRRLDTPAGFLGPDSARTFAGSPERLYTRLQ